jgi:predicted SAM-dependent methyltransferase
MGTIKKLARRALAGLAPWPFWERTRFEIRMLRLRMRRSEIERRTALLRDAMINIGAGGAGRPGWINIDAVQAANVSICYDCRAGLPLPDGAARGVFVEHFLEHLDYDSECPAFLRECSRVLRPGGTLRVIVPDAERYLRAYCEEGWAPLVALRNLQPGFTDPWTQTHLRTKMELVNLVFRQFGEHKFAYDFETLERLLLHAGFVRVERSSSGVSREAGMAIDLPERAHESLYVEASKAAAA